MSDSHFDSNHVPTLLGTSNADGATPVTIYADPVTHRLLTSATTGGTGTYYTVSGTIDGNNATFTFAANAASDYILFLNRQQQVLTTDYTTVSGGGTTTITMTTPPDASYSGLPFVAFVIS